MGNKKVNRDSVLKAFVWYQAETGCTYEECIQLLKKAANSKDIRVRRLAVRALKEVLF